MEGPAPPGGKSWLTRIKVSRASAENLFHSQTVSPPYVVALRIESMEGDQAEVALVLLALGQEVGRKSMWVWWVPVCLLSL